MTPDPTPANSGAASLPDLLAAALPTIEPSLTVIASAVPLPDGGTIDVLAADRERAPVIVLGDAGTADALFERAAEALLGWRNVAPLLARVIAPERLLAGGEPRFLLVARAFPERVKRRLTLLTLPGLRCVAVPEAPPVAHPLVAITPVVAVASVASVASVAPIEPAAPVEIAPPDAAPRLEVAASAPESREHASTNGMVTAAEPSTERSPALLWFESVKQRVLRLSPEVIEEADGDEVSFRIAGQLLTRLTKNGHSVIVSLGGSTPEHRVEDEESLEVALDAVFGRFFGLAATRRRLQAADPRPRPRSQMRAAPENGRRR